MKATLDGELLRICVDSGAGNSLIDRRFLRIFWPYVQTYINPKNPYQADCVGGRLRNTEGAEIELFFPGLDNDKRPAVGRVRHQVSVTDDLQPGVLLGSDFTVPQRVLIVESIILFHIQPGNLCTA